MNHDTKLKMLMIPSVSIIAALGCQMEEKPSGPLAGCQPERPATAHHSGGEALSPQPARAAYPCAIEPGRETHDFGMVITQGNTIVAGPVPAENFVRSRDNGATWEGPLPMSEPDGIDSIVHPWIWQDDASGRIFFNAYNIGVGAVGCQNATGNAMWYSDDEGDSWQYRTVGCESKDWGKIITGPAATAASREALRQSGYPSMVYFCAEGPLLFIGPNRMCYRSVDGGDTFVRTAGNAVDPTQDRIGWPQAGAVGPDGSLYVPHPHQNGLGISTSRDEGDTWADVFIPSSAIRPDSTSVWLSSNVTTDSAGNVYAVFVDERDLLPYISWSRDGGRTYSEPIMVGAPEVRAANYTIVSVRSPGYVVIAYYGSPQAEGSGDGYVTADGRPYHGYMTVTRNLFAEQPLFWSTTINDPATPVVVGMSVRFTENLAKPQFGPDGSAWATFINNGKALLGRFVPPPR
jgi:hypothetical protein